MLEKKAADIPVIGITCGDVNGVGPELIMKIFSDSRMTQLCTPVIYASGKVFAFYRKLLNLNKFNYNQIARVGDIQRKRVNLLHCFDKDIDITPGKVTSISGELSLASLEKATKDLIDEKIDALVTAPINKDNMQSDKFSFPGHTEYLTQKSGATDSLMLMTSELLRVGVITGHIPIKDISTAITQELIIRKTLILNNTLKEDFGIMRPKIAILGLNPHAGENGLLGKEEIDIILPAINTLRDKHNILVSDPLPADGYFGTSQFRNYDATLAMYHDQGLVPFKTIDFESGVNYTAGLNVVRTSPDHGTAYSIAGKGIAETSSMLQSIYTAIDVVNTRKKNQELIEEKQNAYQD